ncbi:MAG: AAA family ATPase, partial [Myxococcales bacterium]|nr:AAA family ATPase [Myxococcales bacterium]
KADFRNVILIMTTNAGARELTRASIGFGPEGSGDGGESKGRNREAVERTFSPEFRNRLDAWVTFNQLAPETIDRVVDKFLHELEGILAAKKVTLTVTPGARHWLREKGYDKLYGARPLARIVQKEIKLPLADEILFGRLASGGAVTVDVEGEGLAFRYDGTE